MEKRKIQLTIWVASKELNATMKAADLKPPYKVYATPQSISTEMNAHISDEEAITKLLQSSYPDAAFWVPAVKINETMGVTEGIVEISDGKRIIFIPPAKKE